MRPYASLGLVRIADAPDAFVRAVELAFQDGSQPAWWKRVDEFLSTQSWDDTWARMDAHIEAALAAPLPAIERGQADPPAA